MVLFKAEHFKALPPPGRDFSSSNSEGIGKGLIMVNFHRVAVTVVVGLVVAVAAQSPTPTPGLNSSDLAPACAVILLAPLVSNCHH